MSQRERDLERAVNDERELATKPLFVEIAKLKKELYRIQEEEANPMLYDHNKKLEAEVATLNQQLVERDHIITRLHASNDELSADRLSATTLKEQLAAANTALHHADNREGEILGKLQAAESAARIAQTGREHSLKELAATNARVADLERENALLWQIGRGEEWLAATWKLYDDPEDMPHYIDEIFIIVESRDREIIKELRLKGSEQLAKEAETKP